MPQLEIRTATTGRRKCALLFLLGWSLLRLGGAQETSSWPAPGGPVITQLAQFWPLATAPETRDQLHQVRMEFLIYYCDTNRNIFWGQSGGTDSFLPLKGVPVAFKAGDKILVQGWALPVTHEFLWDRTTAHLLSAGNPLAPIPAKGKSPASLKGRFVEMEGLADSVQPVSRGLARLNLVTDDASIEVAVLAPEAEATRPEFAGKLIKIKGVYAAAPDTFGTSLVREPTLWTPGLDFIQPIGSLADDPRFSLPVCTAENFVPTDSPVLARVRGTVRNQQPGEAVTIWDATGQIRIQSKQRQPLQVGEHIEAVGYPEVHGLDRILENAIFRPVTNLISAGPDDFAAHAVQLRLADQVRELDQPSLARHPRVNLRGLVTWSGLRHDFTFVQDSSGGLRVSQVHLPNGRRLRAGMLVTVEGEAAAGDFAPVITNATVQQTGTLAMPDAPLISLEQALTGTEDGHWIQMRGYVRQAVTVSGRLTLQLVAPAGEFTACVSREDAAQAPPGSVVLVRGVCVAAANGRRQLTGIEIWSATPGSVQTEQLAPEDLFALPERSIASLRQFDLLNRLNQRVRTAGTVTFQSPGRYLYLQNGDDSLLALGSQTGLLHPGDRVEVVGFPGHGGGKFLLREAVYRRVATGPEPAPMHLAAVQNASEDLDGLLVQMQGTLLDVIKKFNETRFIIQAREHVFEARFNAPPPAALPPPPLGSGVAVTGIYRLQPDEAGRSPSFLLDLRGWDDLRTVRPPPWWTLRRLLFSLTAAVPVLILALFWAWQMRRKNRLLERAQVALEAARDRLEERVAERTRALNEEAEAHRRALTRLSEAQERLLLASRQAGMAEVATGVLHNVGNILNSINVSATVITDSLRRLRIGRFSQAVELLHNHRADLAAFLTQDPRGQALPGYLEELAGAMTENEHALSAEIQSLAKQIEHIKAVVIWQQGNAHGAEFYQSINPAELMEDALQINHAAYERHHIAVVRQFDSLPAITTDRHKVLQILINLLTNARQALKSSPLTTRRVTLRIYRPAADAVRFEVSDTGTGIAPQNLDRIFSLGFTTKLHGHGFGLHSGANSAKELGGRLGAVSEGTGRGATFILEIPLAPKSRPVPPGE